MENAIRTISVFMIMIIQTVLFGQDETPKLFEPNIIKADIDTLIFKLMDVHPTFLNHYNANNFKTKIDSIKNNITNPMSSLDFFRIMQPFVVIDGHTTLRYSGELNPNEENPLFPFRVIIFNDSLYIKENYSKNGALVKGSVIEKINGFPSEKILINLLKYTPGEKESYKIKKLEKDFHVFMALVYGSFSDFTITVNKTELKLKGANWDDFQEPSKPKFELRFYDNDIAYIYKRMFMPPRDFLHFMDSSFTVISQKQINHLIIDNLQGGGLTDLADSLMSYFTDKPYSLLEKKTTKISPLTKEFIEDKKSDGSIKDGYFIEEYPKHSSDRNNRFTGSTYILTGPLSYSIGTCFPAAAKHNQTAFIVGEESGQPLLSNGDQNQFMLPGTKMFCITALSRVYMPGHNNDEVTGVLPDYKVTPTLDDLLDDKEYTLEYTLKLIRKNKLKKGNVIDKKGDYFGQTPPGDTPVIFAPGIVSVNGSYEYGVSFTPDLEEIYFTGKRKDESTSVYFSKLVDRKWTNPKKANLTKGKKKAEFEAFVNHSGNKIYFTANDSRDIKIWCATRSENWWSNAIQLDSPINDDIVFYPNAAKNGDLFYKNVTKGKMYYAPNKNGKFPEILEVGIEYGSHGFISPSQEFMLIDAKKENDNTKDKDIHICFKKKDGTWTKPFNLGSEVNSHFNETCPSISPDGKYLFFSRYDEEGGLPNIYWVSADIIEKLRKNIAENEKYPDLTKIINSDLWVLHNREIDIDSVIHLNGKPGDGLLWIKSPVFTNGNIELDIKGKDERGKSFVGLAFHGLNDSTYEAIYFRPFNFKNPERKGHSVQYISHPEYTWYKLRNEHPENYENPVLPVPEPTDWFHVTILVDYPTVKVFVNNSDKPSLTLEQLSSRKEGWIGFWVGNNSEGYFKNLKIIPE